jgi:hypothetical protein
LITLKSSLEAYLKRSTVIAAVAGSALVASTSTALAQTLKYGPAGDRGHTYERVQSDHVVQTVNGQQQVVDVESFWRLHATIASEMEGEVRVEVTHDSLSVETTPSPASPIDFSSIYGQPITISMSDRGEVREVSLPESMDPGSNRLDFTTVYRTFFPRLPDEDIRAGSTWADTVHLITTQNALELETQRINQYTANGTVDHRGQPAIEVTYQAEVSIEGSGSQQGADISLSGSGSGSGTFYFRVEEGLYLGGSEESEIAMDAFVVAQGQNLLIPILQNRTETVTITD